MRTKILHIGLIAAMGLLAACGSSPRAPQQQIVGQIPAGSPCQGPARHVHEAGA